MRFLPLEGDNTVGEPCGDCGEDLWERDGIDFCPDCSPLDKSQMILGLIDEINRHLKTCHDHMFGISTLNPEVDHRDVFKAIKSQVLAVPGAHLFFDLRSHVSRIFLNDHAVWRYEKGVGFEQFGDYEIFAEAYKSKVPV